MATSVKTKIAAGIGLQFVLLLLISAVALVAINLLSAKTESLLTANNKTIRYCNQMLQAIDELPRDSSSLQAFDRALAGQEKNITEAGEGAATRRLRAFFTQLQSGKGSATIRDSINATLYEISRLNQQVLEQKNERALQTASDAKLWLTLLTTLVVLISFSLALNLPGIVATPVRLLTEGIREISRKNYRKRIELANQDEFGEMADAFNRMAERLDQWEHSSMAQLLFEKSRVDAIIGQMEDAVIGLDAEQRILFINEAGAALLHLPAADVTGKAVGEVARGNDLLRTILEAAVQGPLRIVVDGREQFYALAHKAVSGGGQSLGDVYTLKDITHFRELDLSKTNLLATISHELKTPISSIKLSTRLLHDDRVGRLNAEQLEMVDSIRDDAERLLKLTAELLNMTQLETGNIQLRFQSLSPEALIADAVQAIQTQAQQRGIRLCTSLAGPLPQVHADADKTVLVLINLLSNAVKFSAPDSEVRIGARRDAGHVVFSVTDSGGGIDSLHAARIFDRYYRIPADTGTADPAGTGLGLAIAKEFVEAQGGTISFRNAEGGGAEFCFSIPLA